ncbi:glycosyltransferase family 2 protein [Devosia aurantiaca]|uniref:Glycosyltransferase n=1 Tax=Devosia aurantiaca TaxID=2714858 RepID=A0A6M1SJV7_9HYPH|nr:glycosyltransferase family 2 protein [Devosia aurantiaca]NGP17508.1 glycosyltransferase [Devosia aurantiaca]
MLSLIIATLSDNGTLVACLESLCDQERAPSFEVIIVDQNSDDRAASLIPKYLPRLPLHHLQVNFRGASRARNHGASLASGDWLSFPDDDCELRPNALAEFARIQSANPALKIITGQTVDEGGLANVLRWKTEPSAFTPATMFSSVTEATLFVDAKAYASVSGFDERFGPGTRYPAAEGIELVNRLFELHGHACAYYSPTIQMQHPSKIPPFNRWSAKRFHSYAIGDGALIAKSPKSHVLRWGSRTVISSIIQAFSLPPWRGLSFASRLLGLLRGFGRYYLDRLTGR